MENTKYTFWKVLENQHKIEIPIIQRDYAQGREDERANTIREQILTKLYSSLEKEESLDFDFIYGTLSDGVFVPLDGQQRLTTLFLLHWYLSLTVGMSNQAKSTLKKFTYETRFTSRDFCEAIVEEKIDIPPQQTPISSVIENQPWFFQSWKKDPTIHAMLVMLDAIHNIFYNKVDFFDKLTNPDKYIIKFQFIDLKRIGLSDSLYIRMNARGKELTLFENFKARFEQFLEKKHPQLKKPFAKKIDGDWTDLFWIYKFENLIDVPFVNFFKFISEMLYYREFGYNQEDIVGLYSMRMIIIEKIYAKKENLEFLFSALDLIYNIKDMPSFFESIFSQNDYQVNKVALFDTNVNLFDKCIAGIGFDTKEKVLLFFILLYLIQHKKTKPDEDLIERIRVVRNLLLMVRQRKHTEINSNLRYLDLPERINDLLKLLSSGMGVYELLNTGVEMPMFKESIKEESEKALIIIQNPNLKQFIHALEDHPHFRGAIHNLELELNKSRLSEYASSVYQIWSVSNEKAIVQSMLTIGNYPISIGDCALGDRPFFGNTHRWYTVLSMTGENAVRINKILPEFLNEFQLSRGSNALEKMQNMIDNYLSANPTKDWRYYFIKYPEMLSDNNLYAWVNDFELRSLNRNTLLGYHVNPYVRTVVQRINNENICAASECYSQYEEKSPLKLKSNKASLFSVLDGWKIVLPEKSILPPNLVTDFSLEPIPDTNEYLLKETDNLDRIEIAEKFILELNSSS